VEPLVFIHNGGSQITAYNVYTRAVVRTLNTVVAGAGAMAMSGDGRYLFVYDRTNIRVTQLDATSGAAIRQYPSTYDGGTHVLTDFGSVYSVNRTALAGGRFISSLDFSTSTACRVARARRVSVKTIRSSIPREAPHTISPARRCRPLAIATRGLAASADGTRLISLGDTTWTSVSGDRSQETRFQVLPGPL
jgi:hypothetical protein